MRLTRGVHLIGSGEIGLSNPWDAHVYVLDGGDQLALVDAGSGRESSVDEMLQHLRDDGLQPERLTHLLLTHWHPDHAGGAAEWRRRFPSLRIVGSTTERAIVENASEPGLEACRVDIPVAHGDTVTIGARGVDVIEVPGHSSGSLCYRVDLPSGSALFTGDVVFMNGILGLLNHPDSHLEQYREAFARLQGLSIDLLLPGHMLFFLRDGQRHIDLAADALKGGFVPYSVGQLGIDFRPPERM
jgi:glyoxylase-like metal-dependent hydrolase (beta-lactamase superfamily II)